MSKQIIQQTVVAWPTVYKYPIQRLLASRNFTLLALMLDHSSK